MNKIITQTCVVCGNVFEKLDGRNTGRRLPPGVLRCTRITCSRECSRLNIQNKNKKEKEIKIK